MELPQHAIIMEFSRRTFRFDKRECNDAGCVSVRFWADTTVLPTRYRPISDIETLINRYTEYFISSHGGSRPVSSLTVSPPTTKTLQGNLPSSEYLEEVGDGHKRGQHNKRLKLSPNQERTVVSMASSGLSTPHAPISLPAALSQTLPGPSSPRRSPSASPSSHVQSSWPPMLDSAMTASEHPDPTVDVFSIMNLLVKYHGHVAPVDMLTWDGLDNSAVTRAMSEDPWQDGHGPQLWSALAVAAIVGNHPHLGIALSHRALAILDQLKDGDALEPFNAASASSPKESILMRIGFSLERLVTVSLLTPDRPLSVSCHYRGLAVMEQLHKIRPDSVTSTLHIRFMLQDAGIKMLQHDTAGAELQLHEVIRWARQSTDISIATSSLTYACCLLAASAIRQIHMKTAGAPTGSPGVEELLQKLKDCKRLVKQHWSNISLPMAINSQLWLSVMRALLLESAVGIFAHESMAATLPYAMQSASLCLRADTSAIFYPAELCAVAADSIGASTRLGPLWRARYAVRTAGK